MSEIQGSNQGGKTGWGPIESPVQKVNQDGTINGKSTGGVGGGKC